MCCQNSVHKVADQRDDGRLFLTGARTSRDVLAVGQLGERLFRNLLYKLNRIKKRYQLAKFMIEKIDQLIVNFILAKNRRAKRS